MNLQSLLNTDKSLSALVLRVGLGLALMPHGAQKLFGWLKAVMAWKAPASGWIPSACSLAC